MTTKSIYLSLFLIFAACQSQQTKDGPLLIPIDPSKVIIVNQTDQNGKKQGLWQEVDTINGRITKEFHYTNDLLDSSYLEYKTNSADTFVLGYYRLGKKHGRWKYWDIASNSLDKDELYDNGILIETKKY